MGFLAFLANGASPQQAINVVKVAIIPVTLPIIVAITALCRLIIMQTKDMDGLMVMWEAGAIFVLAGAAYLMSLKDKLSLEKLRQSDD